MFTDSQLEILEGILTRRQDPSVPAQDYDDLVHMVRREQSTRRSTKQKLRERQARKASIEAPNVPKAFNDPVDW